MKDARAELESEDEDEDIDGDFDSEDDLDDDDDDDDDDDPYGGNPPPPTLPTNLPASQGTTAQPQPAINAPGGTQTQASITGTEEAWTRPGGAGVSTRGRVSSPLEGDDGTAELAEELEGELDADAAAEDYAGHQYQEGDGGYGDEGEGEYDDDESLYPDRAAVQERAPGDGHQQEKGGEGQEGKRGQSIGYSFDDEAENVEERIEEKDIDSLFDDGGDEDLIDWDDDVEESMS